VQELAVDYFGGSIRFGTTEPYAVYRAMPRSVVMP